MVINKGQLFKELLENFFNVNKQIEAVIISDEEGLIIAGEKRKDIDMEIVSFLTAVINPVLERIRSEFAFKKFGTASFDTEEHRLVFISINESTTLSLVIESMANADKVSPYAYLLSEKVAQILNISGDELIQLTFPDFEYHARFVDDSGRVKNLVYDGKLDYHGDYSFKFIIIGEHMVGKSSIVRRFVEDKFSVDYRTTIGLNILTHKFNAFNNKINLTLWDIGAQEYFKRYRKTYYRGAQAAFIVFDLTNEKSFEEIYTWHNELMEFIETEDLPIIIVGNKKDLTEDRVISFKKGVQIAKELSELKEFSKQSNKSVFSNLSGVVENVNSKITYIETSALTGENVQEAFNLISHHFIIKSREFEEKTLKREIMSEINYILNESKNLTLTFITESHYWNPGLRIITEIEGLKKCSSIKEKKKERQYIYNNGLMLKSYVFGTEKVSDSNGVLCIFDARKIDKIIPEWDESLKNIAKKMPKNGALMVGIRILEQTDWSQFIEDFNIDDEVERNSLSLFFFKIGKEYRVEMYEQISNMLNSIKNSLFSY